ncbi:dihydroorotate dehydrogenase (quinone), partial [bacterium]|nr:dihydroorotate dehydrogenase (quinone) [bacterium]
KLIIGVGGVSSLDEALQMREAGADLVEIYTAFVYQGPKLVREITKVF